jgi:hypothetical protein
MKLGWTGVGERTAESRNGESASAAELQITYSVNASTTIVDPNNCGSIPAVTSAVAEISPNDVTTNSTGNAFSYDIQTTIGGGLDTGVNRVAITVPGTFGAPTVTDVLVGGSSVAFTDNTSGNAISVDLTTKVTTSSQITVVFSANAPTGQDLVGVDFLSTVDDSGNADVPQATTEGDGDGDAGDNNDWTVTTTDVAAPTPLGRYCLKEAGSGTAPASILDDQASALNLSITYDAPVTWFTHASGNRGLNGASDPHVGLAVAAANGTKYATNLDGATQATFSLVADWLPAADTQRLAGFYRNGDTRVAYIMADGSGRVEVRFRGKTAYGASSTSSTMPTRPPIRTASAST